jgi:hypothetical protein
MLAANSDSPFGSWSMKVTPPDAKRTARLLWECTLHPTVLAPDKKRPFVDFTHEALRKLQGDWEFTADVTAGK